MEPPFSSKITEVDLSKTQMMIRFELPAFMAAQAIDWADLYRYDFLPFSYLQKADGEGTMFSSDILREKVKDQMTACRKLS